MKSAMVGDRIMMQGHTKPATVMKVAVWNDDQVMLDVRIDGEHMDRCCNAKDATLLSVTNGGR